MAITKPAPLQPPRSVEDFIQGAPDAAPASVAAPAADSPKHVMKGRKRQISVTFELDQLDALDVFAKRNNLKRNAAIELSVRQMLRDGITVHHRPVVEEE